MTETLIKIENLHKNFGKNEVLKGIDLEIKKGQVVVIIGPSGSGKSTLLRSMNLLEEATKGKVIFEGVDITTTRRPNNNHNFPFFNFKVNSFQNFILAKVFYKDFQFL